MLLRRLENEGYLPLAPPFLSGIHNLCKRRQVTWAWVERAEMVTMKKKLKIMEIMPFLNTFGRTQS